MPSRPRLTAVGAALLALALVAVLVLRHRRRSTAGRLRVARGVGDGLHARPPARSTRASPAPSRATSRRPWGLAFLPDGSALVSQRDEGSIVRVSDDGTVLPVGTVPGVVAGGEGGLLGIALSPNYAKDRFVYAYLTDARPTTASCA